MTTLNRRSFWKLCTGAPLTAAVVVRDEAGHPSFIGDVSVLRVQPGDLVIVTAPGAICQETAARLKAYFERWVLGPDIKVAILGDGLKIDRVIRRAAIEELAP